MSLLPSTCANGCAYTQPITDTIFSSSQNLCVENIDNAKMIQLQMHTSLTYSPNWKHMVSLHGLNLCSDNISKAELRPSW